MHELKPGQNFSYLFPPVHTCSHLFTDVHNRSHLFTPVHTSVIIYALRAMAVSHWISHCESCYFSILRAILLRLHIFAHLIESHPTVHGLSSCIEIKLSIPLAAHTTLTMYAHCALSFCCIFECSYSTVWRPLLLKNAYFSSANWQLSNGVRLVELG